MECFVSVVGGTVMVLKLADNLGFEFRLGYKVTSLQRVCASSRFKV